MGLEYRGLRSAEEAENEMLGAQKGAEHGIVHNHYPNPVSVAVASAAIVGLVALILSKQ